MDLHHGMFQWHVFNNAEYKHQQESGGYGFICSNEGKQFLSLVNQKQRQGESERALLCKMWQGKGDVSAQSTMTITNRLKITLTPLRLHSASSVRIPNSINNFRTLISALRLRPLNLLSASTVNLHGLANISIFHNNLRVMLSPLKSPVLRKYSNPFKRPGMYPSISKCNAKRCNCCMHLCTNSTVTSSVNGRKFSVVNNSDLD